jgi:acetolactate synthase-1/2/3 large subunit
VFSVPGESFLAALDGLHESGIQNVVCRHEGGAAMMAEATGKMTGKPEVCFRHAGAGGHNAAAGVHVARQDSTPMILFVGDIERGHRDREAFQEVDFRAMSARSPSGRRDRGRPAHPGIRRARLPRGLLGAAGGRWC